MDFAVQSRQMQQEDDALPAFQRRALGVARAPVRFVLRGERAPVENLELVRSNTHSSSAAWSLDAAVLQLLGVHAVPHVLDAWSRIAVPRRRAERPRRGGLVQQVVELNGVARASARDGARGPRTKPARSATCPGRDSVGGRAWLMRRGRGTPPRRAETARGERAGRRGRLPASSSSNSLSARSPSATITTSLDAGAATS